MAFGRPKKSQLGINLSAEDISIAEISGDLVKVSAVTEFSNFGTELSAIVEDEIKFAAVLQKVLRENEFSTNEAVVALPAQDVIMRFFDIPHVSKSELATAVNFEARKYLPFKIEELIFDYKSRPRKDPRGFEISFAALKSKVAYNYRKVLEQVGFKILALEPASLSLLRLLLKKARPMLNKTSLIISLDAKSLSGDILVVQAGAPCLVRDIVLFGPPEIAQRTNPDIVLTKVINEARISIDFFRHRQANPVSGMISSVLFVSDVDSAADWAKSINQELGIECQNFSPAALVDVANAKNSLAKAAGAAMNASISTGFDLNLSKMQAVLTPEKTEISGRDLQLAPLFKKTLPVLLVMFAFLTIILFTGMGKVKQVQDNINRTRSEGNRLNFMPSTIEVDQATLKNINLTLKSDLKTIEDMVKSRVYLTSKLERLPMLMPEGVWLEGVDFKQGPNQVFMTLDGLAYLPLEEDTIVVINKFISNLKTDGVFRQGFNDVTLSSVSQAKKDDFDVRQFQVQCK